MRLYLCENLDRDIEKMKDYRAKGSDPGRLASSVKDLSKAKNRYAISKAIGWKEAEFAFKLRLISLGMSDDDISNIPEVNLSSDDKAAFNKASSIGAQAGSNGKVHELPKLLDNFFRSKGLSYVAKLIPRTKYMFADNEYNNGLMWTLAYEVTASNGFVGYFTNHTNEGGGSYGYAWSNNKYSNLNKCLSLRDCLKNLEIDYNHWVSSNTINESNKIGDKWLKLYESIYRKCNII